MNENQPLGSEIEVDSVVYVSVDFLLQYPEYLDNELDAQETPKSETETSGPEEGNQMQSTVKSEMTINGVHYIALPVIKYNPNYVELKYNLKKDVDLPTFVPNAFLGDAQMAASMRRRIAGGDQGL